MGSVVAIGVTDVFWLRSTSSADGIGVEESTSEVLEMLTVLAESGE